MGYWVWGGGWLQIGDTNNDTNLGYQDFAGSGAVHMVGGCAGLVGAIMVGPRLYMDDGIGGYKPRFEEDGTVNEPAMATSSLPFSALGTLILWVGWYGFNPGSTGTMSSESDAQAASNAAMTTTISAATAGLVIMVEQLWSSSWHHMDVMEFANALLSGLVAATAGCDVLSPWSSIAVGAVAAYIYTQANKAVHHFQIDDVVDAAAVHGASGAWGCIAVGLFEPNEGMLTQALEGKFAIALLRTQLIGIAALAALGAIPLFFICKWLKSLNMLRTSEEEEMMGIDKYIFQMNAYHDTYTDVSQTKVPSSAPANGSAQVKMSGTYAALDDKDALVVESEAAKKYSS